MFKLSGLALDLYDGDDRSVILEAEDRLSALGESKVASPSEIEDLPDEDFALIFVAPDGKKIRKYAMHCKGQTAVSTLYFLKNSHLIPSEPRKAAAWYLGRAHARFGMEPPQALLMQEKEAGAPREFPLANLPEPSEEDPGVKEAFDPDENYLFVKESEDGEVRRFFRVTNALDCKDALATFETDYRDFEPADRVLLAQTLSGEAEKYGLQAEGSAVRKYASTSYDATAPAYLQLRAHILGSAPEAKVLKVLASKVADMEAVAFAAKLEEFDRATNLHHLWDQGLPDPYASVLGKPVPTLKVGNRVVPEADVREALGDADKLAEVFSPQALAKFQEDPIGSFRLLPPTVQEDLLERATRG